jgi:predicted lipid-binding transport protein (Tim44 family)
LIQIKARLAEVGKTAFCGNPGRRRFSMRSVSTLAAIAVLAAAPFASHAQTPPVDPHAGHHPDQAQAAPVAPGGAMGMKGGGMMGGGMMGGDMARMMAMMHGGMMDGAMMGHVEGRLAFLKTELKITPAQEPQWAKFADVIRANAKGAQAGMQAMMQAGAKAATAPEVLARHEKMLTAKLDSVRALKAAFDPLYASLSDEQKKSADELITGPMGMM